MRQMKALRAGLLSTNRREENTSGPASRLPKMAEQIEDEHQSAESKLHRHGKPYATEAVTGGEGVCHGKADEPHAAQIDQ